MKIQHTLYSLLMLGFVMAPTAQADTPVPVQIEINFLLGYLDGSACEFNRNGTWHNAQAAQAHLRDKYKYLLTRNRVNTTEEFIEQAATRSSFTGRAYEVRCKDEAIVSSNEWLRAELARFRTF
jgi:hypothetical protein